MGDSEHATPPEHAPQHYELTPELDFLHTIISGGQTGADQAGLEAAMHMRLKTGGIAPPRFITENGPNRLLQTRYKLSALTASSSGRIGYDLVKRTKLNATNSDGTVVFRFGPSCGTDKTIGFCMTGRWTDEYHCDTPQHRPVCIIRDFSHEYKIAFFHWLIKNKIRTLNVAGHRLSNAPVVDFQNRVRYFLVSVLRGDVARLALTEQEDCSC